MSVRFNSMRYRINDFTGSSQGCFRSAFKEFIAHKSCAGEYSCAESEIDSRV